MEEPIDYVYLYLHGDQGEIWLDGEKIGFGDSCSYSFNDLASKKVNRGVFLLSCRGGAGPIEENVAAELAKKVKATVVACTGGVSYSSIGDKYIPRKAKDFGVWGGFHYINIFGNAIVIFMFGTLL